MNRRAFLGTFAAGALRAQPGRRRPNIIFILADDLGYGDLGCYGQRQIITSSLDRMAAEGLRFTQAYAGDSVCAPSRCCLMTGLHNGHTRVRSNKKLPLRREDITIAEVLKDAGYTNGLIGKWSLGGLGTAGYPTRKGFDEWFGYFNQTHAHNYYPEYLLENDHEFPLRGNTGTRKRDYTHDLFAARALSFVERNRDRPFFLNLCYTIPHVNNEMARDAGIGNEVPSDAPYTDRAWPQEEKNYAAMVTRMDGDVGKLLGLLAKLKIEQDTVVFFTSDNGPATVGAHRAGFFQSAGPLRGGKGTLYEGGIRVPMIVRWPGRIKPGQESDYPWAFWDFMPTAAELARTTAPAGDGLSVVSALVGGKPQHRPYFYWEHHGGKTFLQAVRSDDWKALRRNLRGPLEIYNLKDDLSEKNNVAAQHPDISKKMESILATARTDSKEYPIGKESAD